MGLVIPTQRPSAMAFLILARILATVRVWSLLQEICQTQKHRCQRRLRMQQRRWAVRWSWLARQPLQSPLAWICAGAVVPSVGTGTIMGLVIPTQRPSAMALLILARILATVRVWSLLQEICQTQKHRCQRRLRMQQRRWAVRWSWLARQPLQSPLAWICAGAVVPSVGTGTIMGLVIPTQRPSAMALLILARILATVRVWSLLQEICQTQKHRCQRRLRMQQRRWAVRWSWLARQPLQPPLAWICAGAVVPSVGTGTTMGLVIPTQRPSAMAFLILARILATVRVWSLLQEICQTRQHRCQRRLRMQQKNPPMRFYCHSWAVYRGKF